MSAEAIGPINLDENPELQIHLSQWRELRAPIEAVSEFDPEQPLLVQALRILGEHIDEMKRSHTEQNA